MSVLLDDGNSECLQIVAAPLTGRPFTLSCFFYRDDLTADACPIGIADTGGATYYIFLRVVSSNHGSAPNQVYLSVRQSGWSEANAVSGAGIVADTANQWYHLAGTMAVGGNKYVYLDGEASPVNSDDRQPTSLDLTTLGAFERLTGPQWELSGGLAEVGLWNIDLDTKEIIALSKGFSPLLVRPQNLVAYWPLIREGAAGVYRDIIGGLDTVASGGSATSAHPPVIYPTRSQVISASAASSPFGPLAMRYYRNMRVA